VTSCVPVATGAGRTAAVPCSAWCGPLDRIEWYELAKYELGRADAWRPSMVGREASDLDGLWARWEALPNRANPADVDVSTRQAAQIADAARRLLCAVSSRSRSGSDPSESVPPGGSGWKLPGFPTIPPIPEWTLPTLPSFAVPPWVLWLAIAYVLMGTGDRR
jgi:hypothetical protein